jgi:hypothetical protein
MNCTPRDKVAAEREKAVLLETQTRMLEQQLQQASSRAARTTESYAVLEAERDQLAAEVAQLKLATEAATLAADADKKVRAGDKRPHSLLLRSRLPSDRVCVQRDTGVVYGHIPR